MGQYHILINLDKMEKVNPHALGHGLKQWEQVATPAGMGDVMYVLLTASPARGGGDLDEVKGVTGRWVGDRVVVVGDYTEDKDIPKSPIPASELYDSKQLSDISLEVADAIGKIFGYKYSGDGWRDRMPDRTHWFHAHV